MTKKTACPESKKLKKFDQMIPILPGIVQVNFKDGHKRDLL